VPPVSARAVHEGIRAGLDAAGREGDPYGDGSAAQQIVADLQGDGSAGLKAVGPPTDGSSDTVA